VIGFDKIDYASLTDVGVRRSQNQDAHATLLATDQEKWRERGHVFLVADGMGAHAVGELASELAVHIIPHTYHKHAHQGAVPALRKAFIEANASIYAKGQLNPEFEDMGTTTTALVLRPEGAWIGHVGDSRAYRIRDSQIEQLSFDHSLVWETARRYHVDPDGLQGIPSNVIVRSLGPAPLVQVDVEGPHPVAEGDIFLLCSDGLSGQLSDAEIGAVASVLPPAEACRVLVDLANLRGGPDNITVLIVRVGQAAPEQPAEAPERPPWYRRLPWHLSVLIFGVLLVGDAATLTYCGYSSLGILAFLLAAGALLAGFIGLALSYREEKRRQEAEPPSRPLQVYRHASTHIDPHLVNKLAKAAATLKQRSEERQWEVDLATFQQHHELAESYLRQDSLPEAFREYCRALRPLTEALQRQRHKDELLQPVWERAN
jgi:protein phosphatase